MGYDGVAAIGDAKDPVLAEELTTRFDELQAVLDQHRDGDGFVADDRLSAEQVKALPDTCERALRAAVATDRGGAVLSEHHA